MLLFCLFFAQVNFDSDFINLKAAPFNVRQGEPQIDSGLRYQPKPSDEMGVFLVHANDGFDEERKAQMRASGVRFLSYMPNNAWVVKAPINTNFSQFDFLDFNGDYHPAYKVDPSIGQHAFTDPERLAAGNLLAVRLHPRMDMDEVRPKIQNLGGEILSEVDYVDLQRFLVRVPDLDLANEFAKILEVAWISEKGERVQRNDRSRWIIQSYDDPNNVTMATPVYDAGIHGEGEVVGVIDGRVDVNHCLFADTEPIGPTHRKLVFLDSTGTPNSHGTHVAGSVAGKHSNGTLINAGMAYEAKIAFHTGLGNQSGQLMNTFLLHSTHGAFIHSNSWGEVSITAYTIDCEDIDTFMYQNEDHLVMFASMNGGLNSTPLLAPENALNVLAVGATEAGPDPNPHLLADRHGSCRRGPTIIDGRRKPEIFAPGCGVISANSSTSCGTTSKCGTSMACPTTAGATALVRQYFREGFYPSGTQVPADSLIPSGALLKATLLVGTVNMLQDSLPGDTPIPNDIEGWGRLNLDQSLFFPTDSKRLWVEDIRNAEGLMTGESSGYTVEVLSSNEPLQICMVFTAPPGTAGSNAPVSNNLDLVVTDPSGTTTFLGNVFSNGWSSTGGTGDPINNVEQVRVEQPAVGQWQIQVVGTNVPVNLQGYSMAITGNITPAASQPVLGISGNSNLFCWGDSTTLTGQVVNCSPDTISWTPTTGLSAPNSLVTDATPMETTTYTLEVSDSGGSCMLSEQITITVPAMDLDGSETLTNQDFQEMYPHFGFHSGQFGSWPSVSSYDFDGDGRITILDMWILQDCIPSP